MEKLARLFPQLILDVIACCCLVLAGCEYEAPITATPTRPVEEKLLGNWSAENGTEKMRIRKFDESTYVISYNGQLYRAFHSDVAETPFVSVQNVDSERRTYAFLTWRLEGAGKTLVLRSVNVKMIPKDVKDSPHIQSLLKKNLKNPALLNDEIQFVRER